jgi:hypothetical protein
MYRRIIAGTAIVGSLTLGLAGAAGAASPSGSTGTGAAITPSTTVCSLLPQFQARVQKLESKVSAEVPKAQAREAKAKAAGHAKLADAIGTRITKIQNRETKVNARLAKLSSECGAGGSTGTSAGGTASG